MTVRRATAADLDRVADTLARAFANDAHVRATVPAAGFEERLRSLYALYAETTLALGELWVAGDGAAAAMWQPPGGAPAAPALKERVAELLGERFGAYAAAASLGAAHRPEREHFYLAGMGTAPEHQGSGLGGAVIAPVLARCDAEGLPAATDTSTALGAAFYERRGFVVTTRYEEPSGGPVWVLCRPPAAQRG
ncbi:MAG: GNAT family N-acetyltransferase [Solirubrobacterales bacterium]|nr:GNAT family N-acetyltransferase [Solirubrobacterales bacterium]